jgi:pullulanase
MRLDSKRRLLSTAPSIFPVLTVLLLSFLVTAPAIAQGDPPIPSGDIRIHYHRPDGVYTGWTVYAFFNTTEDTSNYCGGPVQVTGTDTYGAYFDVGVTSGAVEVGLIIHKPTAGCATDVKDPGPNEFVNPLTMGNEYWAFSGIGKLYNEPIDITNPNALLP